VRVIIPLPGRVSKEPSGDVPLAVKNANGGRERKAQYPSGL
jgi:hypothetical protein